MINNNFFGWVAASPKRPFLHFDGREISYGEMGSLVSAFARDLDAMGVKAGDHVAMLCGNRPAYLIAWFALMELGAVTVPLNTALVGDGLRYTIKQSNAKFLAIEPELLAAKSADLASLSLQTAPIMLDDGVERISRDGVGCFVATSHGQGGDALNSILYTSGTTGLPKGVMIPNATYAAAGEDMSAALGMSDEDRIMVFLPLFHANPQMYAVASAVVVGASLVLLPAFKPAEFLDVAARTGATGFTFVGTVLSLLEKRNPGVHKDHALRWCVGGGAPADVWAAIEDRFGVAVRELYGMTETGGWVTMNLEGASRRGSVGLPRRGVTIEVRKPDGSAALPGENGEIVARSDRRDILFPGYWHNPAATAETLVDGWLHTGDLGRRDEDGFLFFEGRLKELIRRGGEMISPVEIEQQILKHPSVSECAVVSQADEVMGEEICAVIVAKDDISAQNLGQFLEGLLPKYMVPRYFSFADCLPKTETSKIQRAILASTKMDLIDLRSQSKGA